LRHREPKCVRLGGNLRGYCGGFRAYHRHFAQVPTTTANKKKENNEVGCIASVTTRLKRRRRKGEKPRSLLQRQVILRKKPNDCANAREKAKKRGKSTSDNGKCSRRKLKQKVETKATQ